jgi:hypothetical protein
VKLQNEFSAVGAEYVAPLGLRRKSGGVRQSSGALGGRGRTMKQIKIDRKLKSETIN